MSLQSLIAAPRILWRDFIMRASDATLLFDELMAAYFFADTAYQYTWSKLDVHRTLLADKVRVEAFEKALAQEVRPGDSVLDLGTGTGILAFLAARAGAGRVTGVDSADIIDVARRTAARNGFKNVEFVRADLRDLYIPKVDLVICELIGMYVTDEGITYKMANARRHLKAGGRVMPRSIDVYLAPAESPDAGLGFWGTLYGIDYSAVGRVPHEIRSYDMSGCRLLSAPRRMFTIDLMGAEERLRFDGEFRIESAGEFHGCVMWFEARLSDDVVLSTDPRKPQTHWKQVFLPYERRLKVREGDTIGAKVRGAMRNTRWRWKFDPGKAL